MKLTDDTHGPVVVTKPRPRCAHAGCVDSGMIRCPVHRDLLCPIHFQEHGEEKCRLPAPTPAPTPLPRKARVVSQPPPAAPVREVIAVGAGALVRRRSIT